DALSAPDGDVPLLAPATHQHSDPRPHVRSSTQPQSTTGARVDRGRRAAREPAWCDGPVALREFLAGARPPCGRAATGGRLRAGAGEGDAAGALRQLRAGGAGRAVRGRPGVRAGAGGEADLPRAEVGAVWGVGAAR